MLTAPEFTKRLKTLENARTGEKVQFECHWTAFPRATVKWYHDDEEINTDDDRFEIEALRRGVLKLTLKVWNLETNYVESAVKVNRVKDVTEGEPSHLLVFKLQCSAQDMILDEN